MANNKHVQYTAPMVTLFNTLLESIKTEVDINLRYKIRERSNRLRISLPLLKKKLEDELRGQYDQ
jgi:hypothetical protein